MSTTEQTAAVATLPKGERLTFLQLFKDKKWKVEIPIIQRDYAQGRKSTKEIRDAFLQTLKKHLNNGELIDLDFVYGSVSSIKPTLFIPLDGQQRLTTLFLLHWYLAVKEKQKPLFDECLLNDKSSNFTYETRASSAEFCDALVSHEFDLTALIPPDRDKKNSLSKTIIDKAWYYRSWGNDPTVQSMLTMLDAIHEEFGSEPVGLFEKLSQTGDASVITFQFLNLKEFRLTDDLYIKMNARGKPLTQFENFKARLEQFISENNIQRTPSYVLNLGGTSKPVSVKEYFAHNIDTTWANLFWSYRDKKENIFDSQLMNYIRAVATNHFALNSTGEGRWNNLKTLIGKDDSAKDDTPSSLSFMQFKETGCLDKNLITNLIDLLDLIVGPDGKLKNYLPGISHYNEEGTFFDVMAHDLSYTQRIRFFSFYQYLITNNSPTGIEDWARVVYNLTENTTYNGADEYVRSMNGISQLLPVSKDILAYLAIPTNLVNGFSDFQIPEERIKAALILKSDRWREAIIDIELHEYFKGQVGFVLDFSGIEEYYLKNGTCEWTNLEDDRFYDSFCNYCIKARSMFAPGGLSKVDHYLWQKALLTKGSYLIWNKSNLSFLVNNDREIGWKRLLRDKNGVKRNYIKDLFDDTLFDANNLDTSLKSIANSANISDWRKHFIEPANCIAYLGTGKYIRWTNAGETIYLLEKQRMSGPHVEYYTYAFYQKYLREKPLAPFTKNWYYEVSGDLEEPCAVITGWAYKTNNFQMDIHYDADNKKFRTYFFIRGGGELNDEIKEILNTHNFVAPNVTYFLLCSKDELWDKLKSLSEVLQKLN